MKLLVLIQELHGYMDFLGLSQQIPQTWWLKIRKVCYIKVLEAESSKGWVVWASVKTSQEGSFLAFSSSDSLGGSLAFGQLQSSCLCLHRAAFPLCCVSMSSCVILFPVSALSSYKGTSHWIRIPKLHLNFITGKIYSLLIYVSEYIN